MNERNAMSLPECYRHLTEMRTDELVVTSASASGEWYVQTHDFDATFYLQASMGMASMFALALTFHG